MIDIIELAKKADVFLMFPDRSNLDRFSALHRQALIDSGELVPRERVEADKRDAERYQWLRNPTKPVAIYIDGELPFSVDAAIDRARSQP